MSNLKVENKKPSATVPSHIVDGKPATPKPRSGKRFSLAVLKVQEAKNDDVFHQRAAVPVLPSTTNGLDQVVAAAQAKEMEQYIKNKIDILKKDQVTQHKLLRLAAFVPDVILKDEGCKVPFQQSYDAVVVMADVSGFTALTEAYSLKGKGGTDQLTKTLASYIGPLAECILRAGGDIIKYAGDAFLAVWRINDILKYPEQIQKVIDCSLFIQEAHGSLPCPEVNITIKVKLGVGAGLVHMCVIGNDNYKHWVVFGPGVQSASNGEKHCVSGEVIVSEAAWIHCNPQQFKYYEKDPGYNRVTDITAFINKENRGRPMTGINKAGIRIIAAASLEDSLRSVVIASKDTKTETGLRTFVIPPVLKKVDDDIPIEYLNESRQVTICFIHIDILPFGQEVDYGETMAMIVQKAFIKIYVKTTKLQGCLTKVIMFDKGLTYLVVFGLPGYITENQSAHALKFSYNVRRALNNIKYVHEVSIGVTTGSCYCGVVGHPQRQEYTVIGRKVNKAARLMCYYPNKLTCDQDTMYHSKLQIYNFIQMEAKELKGISNVGKIYEYLDSEGGDDQSVPWFDYPIIGREGEIKFIKETLQQAISEFNIHLQTTKSTGIGIGLTSGKEIIAVGTRMVAFEGENGVGKTRMLACCMRIAVDLNIKVFSVGMNLMLSGQQNFGITSLLLQVFKMEELRTLAEREDCLRKFVYDAETANGLCMVNDVLQTKFPVSSKYSSMDSNSLRLCTQIFVLKLIRIFYPNDLLMFVVDDAHLMDVVSWEYIIYLAKTPKIFVIASLRKSTTGSPRLADGVTKMIYHNRNVKVIRLRGLATVCCLPLVCQLTEVKAIPLDLEKMLETKSQGIPAWCDQVIKDLLRNGILKIVPFAHGNHGRTEMRAVNNKYLEKLEHYQKKAQLRIGWFSQQDDDSIPSKSILKRRASMNSIATNASSMSAFQLAQPEENINPQLRMIVVKSDTNIANVSVSGTLKEILLDSFDELSSNEQMLIKGASILGHKFSKMMLIRILPVFEQQSSKYEYSFKHLFEHRRFCCASGGFNRAKTQTGVPECLCRPTKEEIEKEVIAKLSFKSMKSHKSWKRPRYFTCKFMEFVKDDMVDVAYELMTEDQRKELHLKAAKYLDSSAIRCPSCGGDDFSYLFGFARQQTEIGSVETEQAFRMAATKRKHEQKRHVDYSRRKSIAEIRKTRANSLVASMEVNEGHKRKASLQTQMDGLKKYLVNNTSKVAQIELDIFKAVLEFETKKHGNVMRRLCLCCNKENDAAKIKVEEEQLEEEVNKGAIEAMEKQPDSISRPTLASNSSPSKKKIPPTTGHGDQHLSSDAPHKIEVVDLRTCECAFVQAKVCIDMVRHYRFAEKYGKCLECLLEAAEAVINVGNGSQALVHLEDAVGLLMGLKNKDFPGPNPDDQDDILIDENEAYLRIDFLNGLANYENGVYPKAISYFVKALTRLGMKLPKLNEKQNNNKMIGARTKLWIARHCCNFTKRYDESLMADDGEAWSMKLRILTYLHILFKKDINMEMARLVTMWQVTIAERYGNLMQDILPAYCNMMIIHSTMSNHKKAMKYEKLALEAIRASFGTLEQVEAIGLLTTANLFYTFSIIRLHRGSIHSCIESAYVSLQISQTIHDNLLSMRVLPILSQVLLFNLNIPELAQCLRKLWYTAEEEEEWGASAIYYALSIDMLLETAYAMEPFSKCLSFVKQSDWKLELTVFKDYEIQFHIEASIALWYTRYSKWDLSQLWMSRAEQHKPKMVSFISVTAELKVLECQLILANHYLENKRYQHFAKSRKSTKDLLYILDKNTKTVPCLRPRLLHLEAYYYRLRSRSEDAEAHLKKAEKLAKKHGNLLEIEWVAHSRNVWSDHAVPTSKTFWLEHTDMHVLDWHSGGKVPWVNIMYSLPIPDWS